MFNALCVMPFIVIYIVYKYILREAGNMPPMNLLCVRFFHSTTKTKNKKRNVRRREREIEKIYAQIIGVGDFKDYYIFLWDNKNK